MGSGLILLLVLIVMFFGMYLYSISDKYILAAKQNKIRKAKLKKEDDFRREKSRLDKIREEKAWLVELRRKEINRQFKWLEEMNHNVKSKIRVK